MPGLKDKIRILNELIISGETIKAMEIFYSNDVKMQENEDVPRTGKIVCIETEKKNLQKISAVKYHLLNQAIDEDKGVVLTEWEIFVTYHDNNKILLKQVSVQHWLEGKITMEKFYYKNFIKAD